MNQPAATTKTTNTLDLNALPPGRASVSWQTDETPEERAHRLATERRDHINAIALGWVLVLIVSGLGVTAAYAGVVSDTEGTRSAAWAVVAAVVAAVPSFFAGRWSSKANS